MRRSFWYNEWKQWTNSSVTTASLGCSLGGAAKKKRCPPLTPPTLCFGELCLTSSLAMVLLSLPLDVGCLAGKARFNEKCSLFYWFNLYLSRLDPFEDLRTWLLFLQARPCQDSTITLLRAHFKSFGALIKSKDPFFILFYSIKRQTRQLCGFSDSHACHKPLITCI